MGQFFGTPDKTATVISQKLSEYTYYNQHFKKGSVVRFVDLVQYIRFVGCVFDGGSMIYIEKGCDHIVMDCCRSPLGVCFITGQFIQRVTIFRSSANQTLPVLPKCQALSLIDGWQIIYSSSWEILVPFHVPPKTHVVYDNCAPISDPRTLDTFVYLLWRFPSFEIRRISWFGPEHTEFQRTLKHPCRREAISILGLLSARVLPGDLIRGGGLVDFLIG